MAILRVAICVGVLGLMALQGLAQAPVMFSCGQDAQIDATKKKAIESVALHFVQMMFGANPSAAFDVMSKAGQAETTRAQFTAATEFARRFEPKNVVVQHTYFILLRGQSPGRVICATDLSKPEGWESLTAENVNEQAYVALSAETRNNKLAIVVWLIPEQKEWKVQHFQLNVSTLGDKDSFELWEMARAQQARQHNFNAALLYTAALQVSDRGPNFQLGITQSISKDMSGLDLPDDTKGQPPFLWKNGEITYKVTGFGPIAIGGKIYVIIAHEVSPWQSDREVDQWNKELLNYFKNRFPEYADVFAGLVARAYERGSNRGYGTVEEVSATKERPTSP